MRVVAIVHEAEEGGYWAEVPALPGCYTQAESLDELKMKLKEVVELFKGLLKDAGLSWP